MILTCTVSCAGRSCLDFVVARWDGHPTKYDINCGQRIPCLLKAAFWHGRCGVLAALCLLAAALVSAGSPAAAQLHIPLEEFGSYMDANGIYTIIGNVKNGYDWTVAPVLVLSVRDGSGIYAQTIPHNGIPAGAELPFKVKMPGIPAGATLLEPEVYPNRAWGDPPDIRVIYDETLVVHPDGHLTGYVTNAGNHTVKDPAIWAVVHGAEGPLDVARNAHPLGIITPGQTVPFSMYPDPAVSDTVTYYSCFAPSDNSVFTIRADRDGQPYDLRYESGSWLYRPVFSADGTEVTIQSTNSYPFETFANLEIPPVTREEAFTVYLDGRDVDFIQSIDEMGMWHLAFNIPKHSQPVITVRGFEDGPLLPPLVPPYLREDAARWADGLIPDDDILETLRLLADRSMMPYGPGDPLLPRWLEPLMEWYGAGLISDDQFVAALSYLLSHGIMRLG